MPPQVFSGFHLKALIYLLSSQLLFLVSRSSSFLQIAEDSIVAEHTDQFITSFSLLFLFVLNEVSVASTGAVLLPSTVGLRSQGKITGTWAKNCFSELCLGTHKSVNYAGLVPSCQMLKAHFLFLGFQRQFFPLLQLLT